LTQAVAGKIVHFVYLPARDPRLSEFSTFHNPPLEQAPDLTRKYEAKLESSSSSIISLFLHQRQRDQISCSILSNEPFECSLPFDSSFTSECKAKLEMLAGDKHSNLIGIFVSDE
jgi:hypothetical protein